MQKKELGKQKKKRIGNLQETFAKDEDQKGQASVNTDAKSIDKNAMCRMLLQCSKIQQKNKNQVAKQT